MECAKCPRDFGKQCKLWNAPSVLGTLANSVSYGMRRLWSIMFVLNAGISVNINKIKTGHTFREKYDYNPGVMSQPQPGTYR